MCPALRVEKHGANSWFNWSLRLQDRFVGPVKQQTFRTWAKEYEKSFH